MAAELKRKDRDSSECLFCDSKHARDKQSAPSCLEKTIEPGIQEGHVSELTKVLVSEERQVPVEDKLLIKEVKGETGAISNTHDEEVGKHGVKGVNDPLNVTIEAEAAEDKGSRHTMEDAWVVLPDASMGDSGKLRCAYFAIFDGHGGRNAAEFARSHLHSNVLSAGLPRALMDVKVAKRAIIEGYKVTDEALLRESVAGGWQDGATAVSVWVLGQKVFVANIGDAKAVLARAPANNVEGQVGGGNGILNNNNQTCSKEPPVKGVIVTREHKAIFPVERTRIQKAGGFVAENGRLLGRLEVSRAFGDRQFKKVGVSAVPDVHMFELTNRELFLILGCDGLWGVFGPSDAAEFVAIQLKEGATVGVACRRLVREAVRERRCKDNCTAVLIVFKHC